MSATTNHDSTQPVQPPSNADLGIIPDARTPLVSSTAVKRKYEQALQLLDDVTGVHSASDGPPMPKRAKTNIYTTLARYGIGTSTKNQSGTPLAHIIQRTKTRSPFHEDVDTKPLDILTKDYDPHSRTGFLTRLHTYKLMTYSSKPPEIDSVAASRCGWRNDGGKETLHCRTCAVSWAMPIIGGDKESWIKIQAKALVERHQPSCPWRLRQCEPSIYSIPISSPSTLSKEVYQRAERIAGALDGMEIKYPLTTDQRQIILSAAASAQATVLRPFQCTGRGGVPPSGQAVMVSSVPSETSCILAFFGWDMTSPTTALLSTSPPTATNEHRLSSPSRGLLVCSLCQRQIPTWNFLSSTAANRSTDFSGTRQHRARAFDVLREHRTHCPYVVKTTPSPSLTPVPMLYARKGEQDVWDIALSPSMELLEGWTAHLNILLRSEWRTTSEYSPLGGIQGGIVEGSGEKPVGGVVEIVRTQHGGGRDLLRFVKGLLG